MARVIVLEFDRDDIPAWTLHRFQPLAAVGLVTVRSLTGEAAAEVMFRVDELLGPDPLEWTGGPDDMPPERLPDS